MAFITYPLNNIDYTAEDAELFHCTRTSGIWAENSFPISVTGADNNVTIGKGIAWINNEEFSGKVTALKSAEVLDLGIADSTYPRIDVIAIQFNANNNATDVIVKKGTPATNPVRPTIVRNGAVYELYIASVYRPTGATAITASNITDLRMDTTVCGLMADSVTKVDMDAIRAQLMGLVEELEEAIQNIEVGGIVPIEKGGTNASTAPEARQNLNYIGTNPIASTADDTPANWKALGTGIAKIGPSGTIEDKPTAYGTIINNVVDGNVTQIWQGITSSGMWFRLGDDNGWIDTWRKVLDETNGIQIKELWSNASEGSAMPGGQNLAVDLNGCTHWAVLGKLTNGQPKYDVFTAPVGKNIHMGFVFGNANKITGYYRAIVWKSANQIHVENSWEATPSTDQTNAAVCIPVKIYGIKGVQ